MSGYAWAGRRPSAGDVGRAGRDVAIGAAAAAAVGLLVAKDPFYALLPVAALLAVWLVVRPRPAGVLLGASIPAVSTVASGHLGLHIGLGDLLLLLVFTAALGAAVLERDGSTFAALGPVARPVVQYCVFVAVLFFAHLGARDVLQILQRYELIAFPLVVGSYLVMRGADVGVLKAYVAAAAVIAVVYPFAALGLQKNPAGQFVTGAILLVVGAPRLSRYRILLPLLVYGLFVTESRGAILACALGIAILLAFRWMHSPRQAFATGLAIVTIAGLAFAVMPPSTQSFITTYGTQGNSHAAWNVRLREASWHDALSLIRAHPWLGVGVGSYANGLAQMNLPAVPDPHNVLLLQAAEGGWLFGVSFIVLILGASVALVRLRHIELAPVALAVLVATVTHGMLDIYWVRGTPVLGWLLTGMVCALAWNRSHTAAE